MSHPIYLDCHATTPVDERVVEAMLPYFNQRFGNPASGVHAYGWEAEAAVERARQTVAEAIGATPDEIAFTSGATEANNLAIKGTAEAYFRRGRHIVTVQTEHRAVLDPCNYLEQLGFEVTYLPVDAQGLLDPQQVAQALRRDTVLVSVMAANNEIGVLQPIGEIGAICQEHGVPFHTDAAQAITRVPLSVDALAVDLMSLTAHKAYGPKGIGALYVRQRQRRARLAPQMHGGGQEGNLRPGTLYPPQIAGMAKAIELGCAEMAARAQHQRQLRQRLWAQLSAALDGLYLNGHPSERLPGNLNISVAGVDGSSLLSGVMAVAAVSAGSACSSGSSAPSHVLKALGHSDRLARASLRFGIGRDNTTEQIDRVARQTVSTVRSLRSAETVTAAKPASSGG